MRSCRWLGNDGRQPRRVAHDFARRADSQGTQGGGRVSRPLSDALISPSERHEFAAFKWGLATGFALGLLVALIVFGASVLVWGAR